jgi:hypothetical protein
MRDGTARVGVAAGSSLVGRFGNAVVLIVGDAVADVGGPADELLDLVEAAAAEAELSGTVIAARLAGWVGGRLAGDDTAFAVVAPVRDGVVVFLRGAVWAEVTTPESTFELSGTQALTWVDRVVPPSLERLAVGSGADKPVRVHPRSALDGGVVPADGFVFTPFRSQQTTGPVEPAAAPAAPEEIRTATWSGSSGGPPAQAAGFQPSTGAEEPDQARIATAVQPGGERPADSRETITASQPVGALVTDGGPTVLLDRAYVLGREPHNDPAVQKAEASPIVIRDGDNLISRIHARVSVDDGSVYVRDAPSVSGTFVAAPGAGDWVRVGTDPTQLFPDWSLRIGKQVFVFQATRAASTDPG